MLHSQNFSFSSPWTSPVIIEEQPALNVPENYRCPITLAIMFDPVLATDGFTYEREAIQTYLKNNNTSPMTREPFESKSVFPNHDKRSTIREFLEQYPSYWNEVYASESLSAELLQLSSAWPVNLERWQRILQEDPRLLTAPLTQGHIEVTLFDYLCGQSEQHVAFLLPEFTKLLKPSDWEKLMRIESVQDRLKQVTEACDMLGDAPKVFFKALQTGLNLDISPVDFALYALEKRHLRMFRLALSQLSDLNQAMDEEQNTLLHLAAKQGETDIVRHLLDHGANLKQENSHGLKAETLALEAGFEETAQALTREKITPALQSLGFFDALNSWSHVVAGHFGAADYAWCFMYDKHSGRAKFTRVDEEGENQSFPDITLSQNYNIIIPIHFNNAPYTGLLAYKDENNRGLGKFYMTRGDGTLYEINDYTNWRSDWTHIIAMNFPETPNTRLLFYHAPTGFAQLYELGEQGNLVRCIKTYQWSCDWEKIVPIQLKNSALQKLFFYKKRVSDMVVTGLAELYTLSESGNLEEVQGNILARSSGSWAERLEWDHVVTMDSRHLDDSQLLCYNNTEREAVIYSLNDQRKNIVQLKKLDNLSHCTHIASSSFNDFDSISLFFFNRVTGRNIAYQYWPLSWRARKIEGYTSSASVSPGEEIKFHVSSQAGPFNIEIYRLGQEKQLIGEIRGGTGESFSVPYNVYEAGCGWPAISAWSVPTQQRSGLYVAKLTLTEYPDEKTREIPFVVTANPEHRHGILLQLAYSTYQAYNSWGGKSLYGISLGDGHFRWGASTKASRVSFDRPYASASFSDEKDKELQRFEVPFIQWLEKNNIEVDYCLSTDLHTHNKILTPYQLFLSVGHDEYWSREMCSRVTSFVSQGGHAAFFAGNICWWKVHFENNNRTMICNKNSTAVKKWQQKNGLNELAGVSTRYGIEYLEKAHFTAERYGYRVTGFHPGYDWVFEHTHLQPGVIFGIDRRPGCIMNDFPVINIVGYETDAVCLNNIGAYEEDHPRWSQPITVSSGTEASFTVLAIADLRNEVQQRDGYAGHIATMGIFQQHPRSGKVFTAATTDWSFGLEQPEVSQITENVIRKLSL